MVSALPWTQWLTLFFQVMPLIFLAGGYANAGSWARHHAALARDFGAAEAAEPIYLRVPDAEKALNR